MSSAKGVFKQGVRRPSACPSLHHFVVFISRTTKLSRFLDREIREDKIPANISLSRVCVAAVVRWVQPEVLYLVDLGVRKGSASMDYV